VAVLDAVCGVFLHFRQDVADDLWRIVGGFLRSRYLRAFVLSGVSVDVLVQTYIYGDVAELGPAEGMVEVVFAEVVLGEVGDVGLLDVRNVRGAEDSNIHVGVLQCRRATSQRGLRYVKCRYI